MENKFSKSFMKTVIFFSFLSPQLLCWGQVQVDKEIYMQFDLTRPQTDITNVLYKTYPPGQYDYYIEKTLAYYGIYSFNYYSLFPQVKKYTTEQIREIIKEAEFQGVLEIIIDINTVSSGQVFNSFTTYNHLTNSYISNGFLNNNSMQIFSGSAIFFDSRDWDTPLVIANANFKGYRNKSLIVRIVGHTLLGLQKNNLIVKRKKIK